MRKINIFCVLISLITPLMFFSCSHNIQHDSATSKDYVNFSPKNMTMVIIPDPHNLEFKCNFDEGIIKDYEAAYREYIRNDLIRYLQKYSRIDHVTWGHLKPNQSFLTRVVEIDDFQLYFDLPNNNTIEFIDQNADIVLILGKIEIEYLEHYSKGHSPNYRDKYYSGIESGTGYWIDKPGYYFDVSYLYWDNRNGQIISYGKKLFQKSTNIQKDITLPEAEWKKSITNLARKLLETTPFNRTWETGSM